MDTIYSLEPTECFNKDNDCSRKRSPSSPSLYFGFYFLIRILRLYYSIPILIENSKYFFID